jgi:hypothetical protein
MADTTWEEAIKCPRCGHAGQETSTARVMGRLGRGGRGATIHLITCRTPGCKWENTKYMVQVNADGSIPTQDFFRNEDKIYERPRGKLRESDFERAREVLRRQNREEEL